MLSRSLRFKTFCGMARFTNITAFNEAQVLLLTTIFQITVNFINLSIDIFYIDSTDGRGKTKFSAFRCFKD